MEKRFLKNFRLGLLVFVLVLSLSSSALAEGVGVYLYNKKLDLPVDGVLDRGRTLVPMREIFEAMDADVSWDGLNKIASVKKDGVEIDLPIAKDYGLLNGRRVSLDVPSRVVAGRTLVPLRFIGESLGFDTGWDPATRSVLLESEPVFGNFKVTRVVDGDTLKLVYRGVEESVRLIGVDTPESVHPSKPSTKEGKIASDFTKKTLEGKTVGLEFDVAERDRYGRLLAYVHYNGEVFNETLLREGYGRLATFPPNIKYVESFRVLEREAREKKKGFWKNGWTETDIKGDSNENHSQKPSNVSKTGKYYGSLKSDKYHIKGCRWEKKIRYENRIGFPSKDQAKKQGYKPCAVCRP